MNIEMIRSSKPGDVIWDSANGNGLHVRAMPSGKKSFYVSYRVKGSGVQGRPCIGDFGIITLAQARQIAKTYRAEASQGRDPRSSLKQLQAEITCQELFDQMLSTYWSQERYLKSNRRVEVGRLWAFNLKPTFGHMKLSNVTPSLVRDWHVSLVDTPYKANRAKEVLSKMFNYALEYELLKTGYNPTKNVKAFTETRRKRFATLEEIKKIGAALEQERLVNPRAAAFLHTLLFSGSRPKALQDARWDQLEIRIENGRRYGVLVSDGKSTASTGESEIVVIPPQALALLEELPRTTDKRIFGINMPINIWHRIRREAGFPDLRARDLRRTFATVGLSTGVDVGAIGELLNHKSSQTTKIYAKLMDGRRAEAALNIADSISGVISGK